MTEGWIKLHRKFLDWEWIQDSNMVSLFIHLLLHANHEKKRWMGIEINPGQMVTGRDRLSEDTGISIQSIRTCLNKLKSTNEITIKVTNKYSLITLTKWDTYQGKLDKDNQHINQQTNQQLTINQPTTNHKQEYKEVKKEKKEYSIPPSLEEVTSYCKERGNFISPQAFLDYYEARGWLIGKVKMKNWQAAIRTWEKNERASKSRESSEFL